ncbi:MAG: hypothetical protein KJO82_14960, partial [Gammaproteobacteria bacterium]|nr:hypothetical protein [Gammaproteobacteria bacterium]
VSALRSELADAPVGGSAVPSRDVSTVFLALATVALFCYLYLPVQMPSQFRSRKPQGATTI